MENRPTFQCTHPLTDKEAAPLLPISAADSDAVSPCRLKGWYLLDKVGQFPSQIYKWTIIVTIVIFNDDSGNQFREVFVARLGQHQLVVHDFLHDLN